MDYKEKYEQIFKRAKEIFYNPGFEYGKEIVGEIFPELKEPKDEIIRKEILQFLRIHNGWYKEWIDWMEKQGEQNLIMAKSPQLGEQKLSWSEEDELMRKNAISIITTYEWILEREGNKSWTADKVIAWLKKQGKQSDSNIKDYNSIDPHFAKHIDKVEPKFKVGDWCINDEDDTIFQITKVLTNLYYYRTNEGKEYSCTRDSIECDAHLWTIDDAKDGDVLCKDSTPFIFKCWANNCIAYCGITSFGLFKVVEDDFSWCNGFNVTPATKEQRDTLFAKMKEAGYKWNEEKLKLEK